MTVYEAVVSRLAMLGYTVTDNDETGLNFLIDKCEKDILADINNGNAYVLTVNDQIAVYGAVVLNGEPAYEFLEGKWLTNSNYYVIHRFATLPKLQREGYARIFINKVCSLCEVEHVPSIKVDTNYDNLPMVSLLSSMGFCLCGKVSYGERGLRFAFEKITMRPKG